MKAFFSIEPDPGAAAVPARAFLATRARVAVYEAPAAAPRVIDVEGDTPADHIEAIASTVHRCCRGAGGDIPYTVIREVTENLIHAGFAEPVISILDGGSLIRFADQGPGIADKERAVLPGFTTASSDMKKIIRGVGSGLPLVKDYLGFSGGDLVIEDNLGSGSVISIMSGRRGATVRLPSANRSTDAPASRLSDNPAHQFSPPPHAAEPDTLAPPAAAVPLSTRQKQVLALVMESGSAGPSLVSRELGVGISTAYRDLASLEVAGLIEADGGKRRLTEEGLSYLDTLTR